VFKPVNRHLLIEMPIENDTESLVILPESYQPKNNTHAVVSVLDAAEDSKYQLTKNTQIVVDRSMIEEIYVGHTIYNVILENYILGILED
jgi:co-chaperonin GroES (HSP10)